MTILLHHTQINHTVFCHPCKIPDRPWPETSIALITETFYLLPQTIQLLVLLLSLLTYNEFDFRAPELHVPLAGDWSSLIRRFGVAQNSCKYMYHLMNLPLDRGVV